MLISVLVPAFNAEGTIVAAVQSALEQVFDGELEVIIYDDASNDDTVGVVKRIVSADPRISLICGSKNGGEYHSRNHLLDAVRGEWIAFLDADDVFLPSKLAMCLDAAISNGRDMVTHDLGYLRADGQVVGRIRADFMQSTLMSRSLTTGLRFSETFSAGGDSQFFGVLRQTAKSIHLPQILTGLRIVNGSLTDKYWFQKRLVEHWHETHKNESPPANLAGYMKFYHALPWMQRVNCLRRWLGQKYGRSAGGAMLGGKPLRAAGFLACSLVLNPGYFLARARRNLSTKS
jgi:glycosyltransferase involved in cell wall biosynthesis